VVFIGLVLIFGMGSGFFLRRHTHDVTVRRSPADTSAGQ
jgi:hypothetical protein